MKFWLDGCTFYKRTIPSKTMTGFTLHPTLERDSHHLAWLSLCEVRLIDDCRWVWLLLVPQRPDVKEIYALAPLDQVMMTFESNLVAEALQTTTECDKLNIATIGNKVPQLHQHIIARTVDDPAWPNPVWGHGTPKPYEEHDLTIITKRLKAALKAQ